MSPWTVPHTTRPFRHSGYNFKVNNNHDPIAYSINETIVGLFGFVYVLTHTRISISWDYTSMNTSWKTRINHISNMISRSIGALNKLKYILPPSIKIMIYNALILPRINYGLLVWGYENEKIFKLQKKAIRMISLAKYNTHTEPLFKTLNLL